MKRIEHREEGFAFPFVEYSPEESQGKLPLVLQLHGAGERGEGGDDLDLVDVLGFSKLLETNDYPCLVIMPQCPKNTFWAARVESIIRFIDQLKEYYDIDESRVYLTGSSMGGFGTWFTAMARPDLFAAIAPVCGGGMGWNSFVLNMPIWAFHGAEDTVVNPFYTEDMVNSLKIDGKNVRYTKIEGVGHNVWLNAYNDELMKWLLSNKK